MKYFVELFGTFIFLSVILITGEAIPIGITLAAMIYWGGKISYGAFNPAVSLTLYLNNKINLVEFIGYMISQFLGGFLAFLFFRMK
jgi:aquaporin Z